MMKSKLVSVPQSKEELKRGDKPGYSGTPKYIRDDLAPLDACPEEEINRKVTTLLIDRQVLRDIQEIADKHYGSRGSLLMRLLLREWSAKRLKDGQFWRIEQNGELIATAGTRKEVAAELYNELNRFPAVVKFVENNNDTEEFITFVLTHMKDVNVNINID